MTAASQRETYPAAGVIPTRPAMAPSQAPTTEKRPLVRMKSTRTQPMAPVEAATLVLKAAYLVAALVRLYSSRQICLYLHGANGGVESRTTVESKPSKPDEDGTKEDQSSVVRLTVRRLAGILALAQDEGVGQTCPSGSDVNGSTSCKVKRGEVEEPAIGVPSPASDRAVDYGSPAEGKHQARQDASTFKGATDDDLNRASAEEQLV